ncbi:uncharacterized protein LOC106716958 [Papilio machaon]|uniref:uncharacterized protein LOC106716958 n=1 Tax=Papilio machaon TaxID=76193 RepID=UPI001E664B50|nr:uncharacterized protein LOC106716958 [Papilio machaon]
MSADDKDTTCPTTSEETSDIVKNINNKISEEKCEKTTKPPRKVSFPKEEQLVTKYFEPFNPWEDVPSTTKAQLAAEYLEACRGHATPPIDSVLQQIRELPENAIGGGARAPRLTLVECALRGCAPVDALEALLRKVQFRRLELDHVEIDDEGAEALFDMIEYYESATVVCVMGPREYGIRGWQATSRMIKKSAELTELEVSDSGLEASHATVLARSLRPATCPLRSLCLQRTQLSGEPLLCLVMALKSNNSVRELRLGDNRLSAQDAAQLASLLRLNTRLQLLDLSNNLIQDAGVAQIADALVKQSSYTPPSAATSPLSPHHCPISGYESRGLAFLVLWNNQLTRNCAVHLARMLRSSSSLCVLNVGRNALGCEAVRVLSEGGLGALLSLGLQAARLGPDAARPVAALLAAGQLQRLDLRDNKLGSSGLQVILNALQENTTITQIDLDDPPESSVSRCEEAALVSSLTRDIRAACRRNAPAAERLHRKISLTCHTACFVRSGGVEEERRASGRLRSPAPSPAPSPAGSPVPNAISRFSVTRVTPDRDSSDSSTPSTPTRPTYCPTSSRFKVVQVVEPPQIQIHPASQTRGVSRFSVTRNYDSSYNPTPSPSSTASPSPEPSTATPSPEPHRQEPHTLMKTSSEPAIFKRDADIPTRKVIPAKFSMEPLVVGRLTALVNKTESQWADEQKDLNKNEENKVPDIEINKNEKETSNENKLPLPDNVEISDNEFRKIELKDSKTESVKPTIEPSKTEDLRETTVISLNFKTNTSNTEIIKDDKDLVKDIKEVINIVDVKDFSLNKVSTDNSDSKEVQSAIASKEVRDSDRNISDSVKVVNEFENISHSEPVKVRDGLVSNTETEQVENIEASEKETVDVEVEFTVRCETIQSNVNIDNTAKVHSDQNLKENVDKDAGENGDVAIKHIEEITEDLGNIIQEMQVMTTRNVKVKSDSTQTDVLDIDTNDVPVKVRDVVLKKNKSESSLDSPDLEVSRLMNKRLAGSAFCDSSSSLEISGSSMESLNAMDNQSQINRPIIIQETVECETELDRRNVGTLSTESSLESNDNTPVNSGFLNTSVSSNESVSPIIFGGKKIHGSLSSLEASMSSLESAKQDRVMVTSADSGIEYSMQNPSENKEDASSNEGTLTHNSSLKETVRKPEMFQVHETLTSPKRTSSLLDVPALKSKGLDRMRKISWVAPSSSFHIPRPEPEKIEIKLPSHLEKLLSLFQHPSSLFSRSSSSHSDDEKKSASNTPPRKDSSLTSSFWSWGSATEKNDRDDNDSLSEATDSTLSERVQVSFVDESFSKKLDSKTPSTDTENTLSEFQSYPNQGETSVVDRVTYISTDENLVQTNLDLSVKNPNSNGNKPGLSDNTDLMTSDLNENVDTKKENNENEIKNDKESKEILNVKLDDPKLDIIRPRSFAAVLKASGSENSMEKQLSPDCGPSVDKLPSKIIRGIKENISPENTLTSSTTNTKALAIELTEKQKKITLWETNKELDKIKTDLAPIATVEDLGDDVTENVQLAYIDDDRLDDNSTEMTQTDYQTKTTDMEIVDVGKDALSYLIYENQDYEHTDKIADVKQSSLAQELIDAEDKEKLLDLSPELVIDEAVEVPVVMAKEIIALKSSPVIPERAKMKKSNSLEDLSQRLAQIDKDVPKAKAIAFKVPETKPRDIPERRLKFRTRTGSSPKSLPECLNKPCPLTKMDSGVVKKRKKTSCLGKMARDSLLALNMSEEETAEFRSCKLTSVESLKSLESVSEDASQSGTSIDSRCKSCLRTSQESLMSLDSINEDCRCFDNVKKEQSNR